MVVIPLPVLFRAFTIHPSTSSSVPAPSASRALCVPKTTLIDGRLFYRHSVLPVAVGMYDEDKRSWSKRVMLEAALDSMLIKPLIGIVVEYNSYGSRSRQFAEELYHELWEGRTDMLKKELFDVTKGVLKEAHYFWNYLSGRAQPAAAFAHMLLEAQHRHSRLKETLESFAKLACVRVPQTAYFAVEHCLGNLYFRLYNMSVDEWPQALVNDRVWNELIRMFRYGSIPELHYMLMQGDLQWLKKYAKQITWHSEEWIAAFRFLHALEPAFLLRFFEIHFAKESPDDRRLFDATAPIAMGVDPTLSNALTAIASENGWEESVAIKLEIGTKLADHKEAGGDVHMQPLQPVAQSLDAICSGARYAASSTLKTAADRCGLQLHLAAGNVLCVLSTTKHYYLHIRNFETGKVSTHPLDLGHPVQVQHGDVITINWKKECPFFLKATIADRGLTRGGCFDCLKAFCYAAKEDVFFVAIVQTDSLVAEEETRLAVAPSASGVKVDELDRKKDSLKQKRRGEKGEGRGSKKTKEKHA